MRRNGNVRHLLFSLSMECPGQHFSCHLEYGLYCCYGLSGLQSLSIVAILSMGRNTAEMYVNYLERNTCKIYTFRKPLCLKHVFLLELNSQTIHNYHFESFLINPIFLVTALCLDCSLHSSTSVFSYFYFFFCYSSLCCRYINHNTILLFIFVLEDFLSRVYVVNHVGIVFRIQIKTMGLNKKIS